MPTLDIKEFSQTVSDLQNLVVITKSVVVTDINDKEQIETVKKNQIALRDARLAVDKKGKELREGAVVFQKEVIARVKELIEIIEPEEERLKAILEQVKLKKLRAERTALLPERKNMLELIGDEKIYSDKDELLLGMDNVEFHAYYNSRVTEKNDADRRAIEERENAAKAEELRLQREAEMREREEKVRQEERVRAEREAKEKEIRIEQERIDREEREARERMEAEEEKAREKARREEEATYQAYLKEIGYEEGSTEYHTHEVDGDILFYKKIGQFQK